MRSDNVHREDSYGLQSAFCILLRINKEVYRVSGVGAASASVARSKIVEDFIVNTWVIKVENNTPACSAIQGDGPVESGDYEACGECFG